ncbi:hypothetical protein K461DRAFT_277391 [Myriangium duriaei CBS 260.36]|uniref:Uncharacterized protein n=1 Tax=Myriangium duriaei CBS 260.36 TaxID=1168546 RepID=A0A9P4J2I7_9PEZI|nr:hypothetical protein K461DRAFT_277391 [Myriangium duriaei CBS 260.36]
MTTRSLEHSILCKTSRTTVYNFLSDPTCSQSPTYVDFAISTSWHLSCPSTKSPLKPSVPCGLLTDKVPSCKPPSQFCYSQQSSHCWSGPIGRQHSPVKALCFSLLSGQRSTLSKVPRSVLLDSRRSVLLNALCFLLLSGQRRALSTALRSAPLGGR